MNGEGKSEPHVKMCPYYPIVEHLLIQASMWRPSFYVCVSVPLILKIMIYLDKLSIRSLVISTKEQYLVLK